MTQPRRLATLMALLIGLALTLPARADDPAQAVQGFFQAVVAEDYARAWTLLSSGSQDKIVADVATSEKMDPQAVRRLFDTSDPSICSGFWASFRKGSKSDVLASQAFLTQTTAGNCATVRIEGNDNVSFLAYLENGSWRFGLVETIAPKP